MFQGMEYVYEVYKEKSFSKAAANLFISQPSLSAMSGVWSPGSAIRCLTEARNLLGLLNAVNSISAV